MEKITKMAMMKTMSFIIDQTWSNGDRETRGMGLGGGIVEAIGIFVAENENSLPKNGIRLKFDFEGSGVWFISDNKTCLE